MSRVFDGLIANGLAQFTIFRKGELHPLDERAESLLMADLREHPPVVIEASNVAQYFYEGGKETWNIRDDVPSSAPPWSRAFIEFAMPRARASPRYGGMRRAALVVSAKVEDLEAADRPPGAKWIQHISVFVELGKKEISLLGSLVWFVADDGRIITDRLPTRIHGIATMAALDREFAQEMGNKLAEDLIWSSVHVAALTFSFINCRNTVVVDCAPPRKLAKASARRGRPLVTYKVLEIEPIKRILAEKGKCEASGLKQALHICRGHFKDYRERGLFGKVKGLFWWDLHVRGTAESGVVVKDYAAPAKEDVA